MKEQKKKLLREYNSRLPKDKQILLKDAKGRNIFEERKGFEKTYGKGLVNEVFGEPEHFEKAQELLFEIQNESISKNQKYNNIIKAVYEIANGAAKLDCDNEIYDKYCMLHCHIPIKGCNLTESPLDFTCLTVKESSVKAEELKVAATWINLATEKNLVKEAYLEYVFELVNISLNEILTEIIESIN